MPCMPQIGSLHSRFQYRQVTARCLCATEHKAKRGHVYLRLSEALIIRKALVSGLAILGKI